MSNKLSIVATGIALAITFALSKNRHAFAIRQGSNTFAEQGHQS